MGGSRHALTRSPPNPAAHVPATPTPTPTHTHARARSPTCAETAICLPFWAVLALPGA